jgi:predicted transcriptional regulator
MKSTHSGSEIMKMLSLKHRPTFLYKYLQPAIDAGLVALTIPEKPKSSKQKYQLTEKGRSFLRSLNRKAQ